MKKLKRGEIVWMLDEVVHGRKIYRRVKILKTSGTGYDWEAAGEEWGWQNQGTGGFTPYVDELKKRTWNRKKPG
jgi:hypothetical protein